MSDVNIPLAKLTYDAVDLVTGRTADYSDRKYS